MEDRAEEGVLEIGRDGPAPLELSGRLQRAPLVERLCELRPPVFLLEMDL